MSLTKEDLLALSQMMDEKLDEKLDKKLQPIREEIRHTRVLLEDQEHNIRLIAEQYTDISLKLGRVNEIDDLRDRVRTLETIARNHSVKFRELEKAE